MHDLKFVVKLFLAFICSASIANSEQKYTPTWDSLDSRPLPTWFDDSKIGLMLHWGVYSVPAVGSEWFWFHLKYNRHWNRLTQYMRKTYKENTTYAELAPLFTASLFDANQWAKTFKKSGVKYVVLTGKHLDGFTLWPSKSSLNWNAKEIGPKRDLFGELGTAVKQVGLRYGVYYSLYEWYNPLLYQDYLNNFNTTFYTDAKILPELRDVVNKYKPDIIWSMDNRWMSQKYLKTKEFLAWLYNESPVKENVVVNDRWGAGTICKHGGFLLCNGRHQPNSRFPRKWETAVPLDRSSWGFNRLTHSSTYMTIEQLLTIVARMVSGGGNLLLNVGPTHDGRIPPIMEERLLQLGEWLNINGIAIYKTEQWKHTKDSKATEVYYTKSKQNNTIFAIILQTPKDNLLQLGSVHETNGNSKVSLLTKKGEIELNWRQDANGLGVQLIANADTKWFQVLKISEITDETDENEVVKSSNKNIVTNNVNDNQNIL